MDFSILSEEALRLPINYDDKNGFTYAILNSLNEYLEVLKRYNVNTDIISEVRTFNGYCEKMYESYFLGHHNAAYDYFLKAIEGISKNFSLLIKELDEIDFYRARLNKENTDFKENEMNHIPLNRRGIIKTQRYSFPGLPCLYLGGSSYACWVELNRPPINEFQVALIKKEDKENKLRVVDLSVFPITLKSLLENNNSNISLDDYLLLWPVIAMCSIIVKNESDDFKP